MVSIGARMLFNLGVLIFVAMQVGFVLDMLALPVWAAALIATSVAAALSFAMDVSERPDV